MSTLHIDNISMRFDLPHGGHVQALKDVALELKTGELMSVLRPSGCGKTTLLNIIGMLDNPTEGSYVFAGHEVSGLKESQRTKLRKENLGSFSKALISSMNSPYLKMWNCP